jgi:RHS repeat-associated protein
LDFAYDHQGRRITKRVWNNTTGTGALAVDQKFLYDGWNLVAELNATNNTVVRSHVWGLDLSGSLQGAGGVGGLLWLRDTSTLNNQPSTHFASYDGNGNVTMLVNATDGTETARYEYGPFGELLRATGPMAKANPFRFSTKYQDGETDLLYYGYRYYNASTGRWLSPDPIGDFAHLTTLVEIGQRARLRLILDSSLESRLLLIQIPYYQHKVSQLLAGGLPHAACAPAYVFVGNSPVGAYDPDGQVAQWLAECGVGCLVGGIGGAIGGLGGGWKGVGCGAWGGAVAGCCSAVICANFPQWCIKGSCLCGALGSVASQLCSGGINYRNPCAWVDVIGGAVLGCVDGVGAEDAKAKLVLFLTGIDMGALNTLCGAQ